MSVEAFLIAAALFLFAYPLIMRMALEAARNSREQLIALSNQIVYDPKIGDREKTIVMDCLDDAWSPWVAPRMAFTWPVFMIRRAMGLVQVERQGAIDPRMGKFIYCWVVSITAANPFFGIFIWFEFLVLIVAGKIKGGNGGSALAKAERQIQQVMCT